MKYRSSNSPARSASARRTSRHAALTQSTSRTRELNEAKRRRLATVVTTFCRSSLNGEIIFPNESSGLPRSSTNLGPDDRRSREIAKGANERINGAGGNNRVTVEQQNQFAARLSHPGVVRPRETDVGGHRNDTDVRPAQFYRVDAAISRRIVDDDDLMRNAGRMFMKRSKTMLQIVPGVMTDDDDGEIRQWQPPRAPKASQPRRVATSIATGPRALRGKRDRVPNDRTADCSGSQ